MAALVMDAVDRPPMAVTVTEAPVRPARPALSRRSESWLALVGVRGWTHAGRRPASAVTLSSAALVVGAADPDAAEADAEGDAGANADGGGDGRGEPGAGGEGDLHRRLARELHDAIGCNVSLVCIQAAVALDLIGDDPGERLPGDGGPDLVRESLLAIRRASRDALQELRSVLGALRQVQTASSSPTPSPSLTPTLTPSPSLTPISSPTPPGLGRLDELVERFGVSGLGVRVERLVPAAAGPLPHPVDAAAFRIVQESLTNVVRHSGAATVHVRLVAADRILTVDVLDDGPLRRAPALVPSGGLGITGMRERAVALGGRLHAGPRAGGGFGVRAELPLSGGPLGSPGRRGGGTGQRGAGGAPRPPDAEVTPRRP